MGTIRLGVSIRFPHSATPITKHRVARDMALRGEHFAAAAMLLKREGGHGYVWRHNFAQAVELLLKGALLLRDFDSHWPRLRRYGHRLLVLSDMASAAYGVKSPRGAVRDELAMLSTMYEAHLLRYASGIGDLVNPETLHYGRILRRFVAVQRLLHRADRKASAAATAT